MPTVITRPGPQRPLRHLAWLVPVVACWLLAQAAAFWPELHRCLHESAGKPEHQCAAVLFQQGLIESAPAHPLPVPPAAVLVSSPEAPTTLPAGWSEWLPPGRAPPAA